MKIIVEPSDYGFGQAGIYECHQLQVDVEHDFHRGHSMKLTLGLRDFQPMLDVRDILRTLLGAEVADGLYIKAPEPCDECKGTGFYTCPITDRQSLCSKGCRAP